MQPNQDGTELNDAGRHSTSIGQQNILRDYPNTDPYDTKPGETPYKMEIAWIHVIKFAYLHVVSVTAIFLPVTGWQVLFWLLYSIICGFGVTAGAHRYWAHRSYKVTRPLYFILLILQTAALQDCVIEWVKDHRIHHKYSDTNADPHNANRGFFFSHIGWMMCKLHPDVEKYSQRIDMSDLTSDPYLRFQKKHYIPLAIFIFVVPSLLCMYLFDVSFWAACYWNVLRYMVVLHVSLSVNSVSHLWGNKPFDKDVKPTETYAMGFITLGEGWHNYHHVYPFDYKCSELPFYWCNLTTSVIDFFACLGWAYDLKTMSLEMVRRRVLRTGDGSHRNSKEEEEKRSTQTKKNCSEEDEGEHRKNVPQDHYWGWGDGDIREEDINDVRIFNAEKK